MHYGDERIAMMQLFDEMKGQGFFMLIRTRTLINAGLNGLAGSGVYSLVHRPWLTGRIC